MIAVTYRLTLRQPVLAHALDGDPNSAVSYPFIPGSMIRGLIASHLSQAGVDLAVKERELLFDSQVRYLNVYPADSTGKRSVPIPLSWQRNKDVQEDTFPVWDEAAAILSDEAHPSDLKGFGGFTWPREDGGPYRCCNPQMQVTVHTLRSRKAGRSNAEYGQVYRYEAIAASQEFAGAILAPTMAVAERVKKLLPIGAVHLGGAATAGYGLVEITSVEVKSSWDETNGVLESCTTDELFVVTLLSDAILRGADGAMHTDLTMAIGLPAKCMRAFKQVRPIGGFNRKWGLPTPQYLAVQAGSVFVLRATADIGEKELERLLIDGVGEQRESGFGRISINWQTEDRTTFHTIFEPLTGRSATGRVDLRDASPEIVAMAQRMATRKRQSQLDSGLTLAILAPAQAIHRAPPNSQLGRIRVIIRHAAQVNELARVAKLFETNDRDSRKRAVGHFQRAQIGREGQREPLAQWISGMANNPTGVWEIIHGGSDKVSLGEVPTNDQALAMQYAAKLIDGVLERAMKENTRKDGSRSETKEGETHGRTS